MQKYLKPLYAVLMNCKSSVLQHFKQENVIVIHTVNNTLSVAYLDCVVAYATMYDKPGFMCSSIAEDCKDAYMDVLNGSNVKM